LQLDGIIEEAKEKL